jgi:molybdate transport system regulatory protein
MHTKPDVSAALAALAATGGRNREESMAISSRNTFVGTLRSVRETPILTEVTITVDGLGDVVALITSESFARLGLTEGEPVTALVKATELFFTRDGQQAGLRTQNCLPGRVINLDLEGATIEIQGELDDGTLLCAIGSAESVESLGLALGDRVWFFFKAMSLIVSAHHRLDELAFLEAVGGLAQT